MRIVAVALGLVVGLAFSVGVIVVAPALDTRWENLDATRPETVQQHLQRDPRATLLFIPNSVRRDPRAREATIVVVLPGLGGIARPMAEDFVNAAEENRWLLLAPSPDYDPRSAGESLNSADLRVDDLLLALIDRATAISPAPVAPATLLVGFSRGAQQAHRFVLRHPDRVAALATLSAGAYTMPNSRADYPLGMNNFELWDHNKPFDLAALQRVRILVGVGALDNDPSEVVRAWDEVGGTNRLDRALRFAGALSELHVPYRFQSYAGTRHVFISAMRDDAVAWFKGATK